jgi:hypothetical protein
MRISQIFNEIYERPKAIIVIGFPRSGKTYWSDKYRETHKLEEYVDLNIANYTTPEERGNNLNKCIEGKKSFIYEGLALIEDRFNNLLKKLKKNGYNVTLVYINRDILFEDNKQSLELREKNRVFFEIFKDKVENSIQVTK